MPRPRLPWHGQHHAGSRALPEGGGALPRGTLWGSHAGSSKRKTFQPSMKMLSLAWPCSQQVPAVRKLPSLGQLAIDLHPVPAPDAPRRAGKGCRSSARPMGFPAPVMPPALLSSQALAVPPRLVTCCLLTPPCSSCWAFSTPPNPPGSVTQLQAPTHIPRGGAGRSQGICVGKKGRWAGENPCPPFTLFAQLGRRWAWGEGSAPG